MNRPTPNLERFLSYRLHRLKKLTDRQTEQLYKFELNISLSDARCISAIGHFQQASVSELANLANLDTSQASRAAANLVARGLVEKQADSRDSRAVSLKLSRPGQQLHKRILDIVQARNDSICSCLTEQELATLNPILDKLCAHAAQHSAAVEQS